MKQRLLTVFLFLPVLVLIPAACTLPSDIIIHRTNLFPEGIVWDSVQRRFLISSLREGTIGSVNDQGVYTPLIQDDVLISSVGLRIDHPRRRLIVCVSDRALALRSSSETVGQLAAVAVYQLDTGKRLAFVELARGGNHFANAADIDADGNIYVSDSRAGLIYKVDLDYAGSVFVSDNRFQAPGIGPNGLRYHPDGFLIMAQMEAGQLYKIDLKDRKVQEVQLAESLPTVDGLVVLDQQRLAVIQNGGRAVNAAQRKVEILSSKDNWQSAQSIKSIPVELEFPTTGTLRDDQLYILSGRFNRINKDLQPPTDTFMIRRIGF